MATKCFLGFTGTFFVDGDGQARVAVQAIVLDDDGSIVVNPASGLPNEYGTAPAVSYGSTLLTVKLAAQADVNANYGILVTQFIWLDDKGVL